jgi:CRISPR-associated endonuclease Csn1
MAEPRPAVYDFVLGLDLGAQSVGWALIARRNGVPERLVRAGARVFESGMEGSARDFESGREKSRNQERREARQQRRQIWRRARRLKKIFHLLQKFGLLPQETCNTPAKRQDLLNALDRRIFASQWFQEKYPVCLIPPPNRDALEREEVHRLSQLIPYLLRAAALDEMLESHFLGRALYHLAQRRGFQSGRKQMATAHKDDEDEGKVKKGIKNLRSQMNGQTLGKYFSFLSPIQERIRGVGKWTARDMFKTEFQKIWEKQATFHPEALTEDRKTALFHAMFDQRPLKIQYHLIGFCDLEPDQRRAPLHILSSQRFRLLQKVNDLRVGLPDGRQRDLTSKERVVLIDSLEKEGDLTFAQIRKIPQLNDVRFTLERSGEKKLPGNRTESQFRKALGGAWEAMSPGSRNLLVAAVSDFEDDEKLKNAIQEKWRLSEDQAQSLTLIRLEPNYLKHSLRAVEKLLPLLEQGFSYGSLQPCYTHFSPERSATLHELLMKGLSHKEACQRVFAGITDPTRTPVDALPPVALALKEIRNPGVMRTLTELRKVVNAIVRQYGKPAEIRVELAREMKKPKWLRERISKRNRDNQSERNKARARITEVTGDRYPSNYDIRKVLLFDECCTICAYCGQEISWSNFFGKNSDIDVDHIIPFSRCQDDSFVNLVICHAKCNREKGNRTPSEAFSGTALGEILDRIRNFTGNENTKREKLRRFAMVGGELLEFLTEFTSRQLNDTAYASKLTAQYLGLLYGGDVDAHDRRRVSASSGGLTKYLRDAWNLNSILNDGATNNGGRFLKSRDDHRHHAVDAIVIGLTNQGVVEELSRAAARGFLYGKPIGSLKGLWPDFVPTIRAEIERISASHRVSKKVSGAQHKDSFYSREIGPKKEIRLRVPLTSLSEADIASEKVIADKGVREQVQRKLASLGGGDPGKLFATTQNLPHFEKDGRIIPIKKVRVNERVTTKQIGEGRSARYVKTGGNHHLEIFAEQGPDGHVKRWDTPGVVTMMDAYERQRTNQPITNKQISESWEFVFSLSDREVLECDYGRGNRRLFVVRAISEEERTGSVKIEIAPINDARQKDKIKKSKQWITKSPNELRKWKARKVVLNPLGEPVMTEAHD